MRRNTFEYQEPLRLPVLIGRLDGSPGQSSDDDLYTFRTSPMLKRDDICINVNPKDLDQSDSLLRAQRHSKHVVGAQTETPPPESMRDLRPQRKRRHTETSDTDSQAELRRQRNRLAASKCRRKSKQKNEIMLERERELEQQYHLLKSCVQSLKVEVLDLREELLKHAHCDCEPIQNHISKTAQAVMSQPNIAAPWRVSSPQPGEGY
ncbi:hypothetical protein DL764_010829 [Monosporascus ibericus]|uniref:BZIP domain-containing protein n=1 Tax=Monosporascus ibericus TaxID=155417 RepID=A0A4Q4STE3_9PEZI|nr:hypothetical protein DL764_010829 [Monosporascus ibericus]